MPNPEPDPSGDHSRTPPFLRVAIGGRRFGPGHRILIILSDPREETLFVDAFSGLGWIVELADDMLALQEVLAEGCPPIALTDEPRVVRILRSECPRQDIHVVMLADDRPSAIDAALVAGVDHVLTRPVDPDDPLGFTTL